jgi:3-phosphoglycerate kinase
MTFTKKTVENIDLRGKTVLLRSDFNVPLDKGNIRDDYRIEQALPTIKYLQSQNCRIIICSHLGRPDGKPNPEYSLKPVQKVLSKLVGNDVAFVEDCVGPKVAEAVAKLEPKHVLLLENLRFHPEEANDMDFAKALGSVAEVFVQDGFGVVHRKHASTDAITRVLPSVAGLLLEKEVTSVLGAIQNPKRPLMTIVGGAKISDKIDIIKHFISTSDIVVIGGAMANTFLLAKGMAVGKSLVEKKDVPLAKKIIELAAAESKKRKFIFYLPQDSVVAKRIDSHAETRIVDWDAHAIAEIESYPRQAPERSGQVAKDELILDIGPFSGAFIAGSMQFCETVIWNGVMGVTETPSLHGPVGPFAHGTELVLDALLGQFGHKPYSLIGGGDTSAYVEQRGLVEGFNHVSTGGGACLDLLAGKKLPGVEALLAK